MTRRPCGARGIIGDFKSSGGKDVFSRRGKSRDREKKESKNHPIESRGIQRELPQTVSKVRPAVTMATAWHPRGIKVDESERGGHEEMTS